MPSNKNRRRKKYSPNQSVDVNRSIKKRKIREQDDELECKYDTTDVEQDQRAEELMSDEQVTNWLINQYTAGLTPTKRKKMKCYWDTFNPEAMKELLTDKEKTKRDFELKNKDINQLIKLNAISRNGFARIYYYRKHWLKRNGKRGASYGRKYAYCWVSLQSLNSKLRKILCQGISRELDMVNAHVVILNAFLKKENVSFDSLEQLVNDREDVLEMLRTENGISRKEAKVGILTMLYGGKPDFNEPKEFLQKLSSEYKTCQTLIRQKHPKMYEQMKMTKEQQYSDRLNKWKRHGERWEKPKRKDPERSLMAFFCQDIENKAQDVMMDFLERESAIVQKQASLIFDGILVKESEVTRIQTLMKDVEDEIEG